MQASFIPVIITVASFFLTLGSMYTCNATFNLLILTGFYLQQSIEWSIFSQAKFPFSHLSMLFGKLSFDQCLFLSPPPPPPPVTFHFKLYQISSDSTLVVITWFTS